MPKEIKPTTDIILNPVKTNTKISYTKGEKMKAFQRLKSMWLIAIVALVLAGCSNKGPEPAECNLAGPDTPLWICIPEAEGMIVAVGQAEKSVAGLSFQRQEAMANGRDELARQIGIKVQNMFKTFTQTTGVGDAQTLDKVAASVSKQVANQTLNGSKIKNMYQAKDGRLFVLVAISADSVNSAVKTECTKSLSN